MWASGIWIIRTLKMYYCIKNVFVDWERKRFNVSCGVTNILPINQTHVGFLFYFFSSSFDVMARESLCITNQQWAVLLAPPPIMRPLGAHFEQVTEKFLIVSGGGGKKSIIPGFKCQKRKKLERSLLLALIFKWYGWKHLQRSFINLLSLVVVLKSRSLCLSPVGYVICYTLAEHHCKWNTFGFNSQVLKNILDWLIIRNLSGIKCKSYHSLCKSSLLFALSCLTVHGEPVRIQTNKHTSWCIIKNNQLSYNEMFKLL